MFIRVQQLQKTQGGITYNFTPLQQKVVRVSKFSERRHKIHDVKEQGKKTPDQDKSQRKKLSDHCGHSVTPISG